MSDSEELIRAVNANIARGYDTLAYEDRPESGVSAERVLGVAALYGAVPPFGDVLDIGCGRGARLDLIGEETSGALVGVDIAVQGLEEARLRLGRFADRVKLVHGDLMDVMPGDLGQFDLIYCTGLIFVVPGEVRRRTLKLISACLKPGGVAVVSYYAGANAAVRSQLYRLLRNGIDPNAPPEAKVAVARKRLAQVAEFAADNPAEAAVREAVEFANGLPDVSLFHEALNETSVPVNTGDLEAEFAPQGVHFLGYSEHGLVARTSRERAWAADFVDLARSPYRYGIFAKVADGAPNMASDKVRWASVLSRNDTPGYDAPARYVADDGRTVDIPAPLTQAALDELASAGALAWGEMIALAKARLKAAGVEAEADAQAKMEAHFQGLWRVGYVTPLRMKD